MTDDEYYQSIADAVPPSLNDERRRMAKAGDFEGLMRAFQAAMPMSWDTEDFFPLLQQAVKVAADADPAKFAQRNFSGMVGFTAYLGLRCQLTVERILAQSDRIGGYRVEDHWLRPGPTRDALEALQEFQSHLANMHHAQACTERIWSLARQRQDQECHGPDTQRPSATPVKRPANTARRRQAGKTRRPTFVARNGTTKSPKGGSS